MAENTFKPYQFGQFKEKSKEDKDKTAVAIAYEPGEAAPKILATGKGLVAEKIIETAKENHVPTYQDAILRRRRSVLTALLIMSGALKQPASRSIFITGNIRWRHTKCVHVSAVCETWDFRRF